ncbi:MAG: LysR family transcriptional regulator [Parasphingorhabdus sp.]|nr:LysR family transcriptional regulator [Parasphingorhabdus sp.]
MRIQKLEELLGVMLFNRSKKPVLLTDEEHRRWAECCGRSSGRRSGWGTSSPARTRRRGATRWDHPDPGAHRPAALPWPVPGGAPAGGARDRGAQPNPRTARRGLPRRGGRRDAAPRARPRRGRPRAHQWSRPRESLLAKKSVSRPSCASASCGCCPRGRCFRSQVLSYCGAAEATAPLGVQFESGSFETLMRSCTDAGLGATVFPALVARGLHREAASAGPPARAAHALRESAW